MIKRPPRNGETVKKMQNTLLVDGNSLFKNSFFGAKDLYNEKGIHIGGLYQFMTTLRMVLENDLYHRVYVFWDGNLGGKLRYDIYKDYKSNRNKDFVNGTHPVDESELLQRRVIWQYINDMYIRQLCNDIIESDDFIAYYCLNKKENEKITICSADRDMCQLITDDVRVYFLDLKKYVVKSNFNQYFCYNNENSVLVKTLTGDSSDCIKGIKGLGVKTLLKHFPEIAERKVTLEEIIEKAKILQEKRKNKPLKILDNIINRVTEGVQGTDIYEINERLVNLNKPMLTEDGIRDFEKLLHGTLDSPPREMKKIQEYMIRDGMDKVIGEYRWDDYLIPFKKLIEREKIIF